MRDTQNPAAILAAGPAWSRWLAVTALLLAIMTAAQPVRGEQIQFTTPPGANFGGQAINAVARFDIDPLQQQVTVSLLNLQMNPLDVTQLISGVAFSFDNINGDKLVGTLDNSSGTGIWIDRNGVPTIGSTITPTQWKVVTISEGDIQGISSEGLFLCEICRSSDTTSDPDELVIGGPGSGGLYVDAGGSIAGNKAHNPFLLGTGGMYTPIFILDVANTLVPVLTDRTTIKDVTLTFGTTYGANQMELVGSVPEPGIGALTLSGLALLGLGWRFRPLTGSRSPHA